MPVVPDCRGPSCSLPTLVRRPADLVPDGTAADFLYGRGDLTVTATLLPADRVGGSSLGRAVGCSASPLPHLLAAKSISREEKSERPWMPRSAPPGSSTWEGAQSGFVRPPGSAGSPRPPRLGQ